MAFVVAAPVLDPILFGALLIIVGWKTASIYVGVAFAAALGLALMAEKVDLERYMKPLPTAVEQTDQAESAPWAGLCLEW